MSETTQREVITVKTLSPDGIRKLVEEKKADQIVQVLRILEESPTRDSWIAEISDGYSKITGLFIQDAAKMINTGAIKKFGMVRIIEAEPYLDKGTVSYLIVRRSRIEQRDHKGVVGKPVDYQFYKSMRYKSFGGSNQTSTLETAEEIDPVIERSHGALAIMNLCFSMTMGAAASIFVKKYKKTIIAGIGFLTLLSGFLSYQGIIVFRLPTIKRIARKRKLMNFIAFGPPGFALGFYLGIKNEWYNFLK